MTDGGGRMADEAAVRRLVERYAEAIDRHRPEVLPELFLPDAVIEGPGFAISGIAQIQGIPNMLRQRYRLTLHLIHNQSVMFAGDSARAETACTAHHLEEAADGQASNLVWYFRYQDQLQRVDGQWRFSRRTLIVDWTETRPARWPDASPG